MITEPKIERRKKQYYVAIRMAVPIPFGKYLQPAWDEVYDCLKSKDINPSGPASFAISPRICPKCWILTWALPLTKP